MISRAESPSRRHRWRLSLAAVCVIAAASFLRAEAQPSLHELVGRIDHHYNSLHSLSVHFVQQYEGMGMHRENAGVLLLRKPGKMRWTYTDPAGKLFVLDGHYGYFYSPGATEAQKIPQKKLDDIRSPLRFLLGHTELERELTGLRMTADGGGLYTLTGVPKGMEQRVRALSITADGSGVIRSMRIVETDGVTNSFAFSGERDNAPAPDSAFVFTAPPGVHVVEGMPPV